MSLSRGDMFKFKQIKKYEAQIQGLCENCQTQACDDLCLLIEEVREDKNMNHEYYSNQDCKFYPCHEGVKIFNCKHCYCPLYFLDCEGDFRVFRGIKDCSRCRKPHEGREGHKWVVERLKKLF